MRLSDEELRLFVAETRREPMYVENPKFDAQLSRRIKYAPDLANEVLCLRAALREIADLREARAEIKAKDEEIERLKWLLDAALRPAPPPATASAPATATQ